MTTLEQFLGVQNLGTAVAATDPSVLIAAKDDAGNRAPVNLDSGRATVALPGGAWQAADAGLTRPANTTPYTAHQAVGSGSSCVFQFSSLFRKNGGSALLLASKLVISGSGIAVPGGINVRGHLFNATPSSPPAADAATFQTLLADATSKVAIIEYAPAYAYIGGAGSDAFEIWGVLAPEGQAKPIRAAGGSSNLWMILETVTGYTPNSGATYQPYLMAEQN